MKRLERLELWAGRLPIGRAIEFAFVAFLILVLALMARPAHAQDAAQMERIATAAALEKAAEAQIATAKVLQTLAERMPLGGLPVAPQAPVVNPAAKTCDGFGSCLLGVFKTGTEMVGDVVRAVTPIAAPYYGYKTAIVSADAQKVSFVENTKQVIAREGTTQSAFGSMERLGIAAATPPPAPPGLPTTAITLSGNTGPVLVGGGTLTNASQNPVNPAPVVCTLGTATTPGTCSR